MRTPALKAPDGRLSRSCHGQAPWPGAARRRAGRSGWWCRRPAPGSRGSLVLLVPVVAGAAGEAGGKGLGAGAGLVAFGDAEVVVELPDLGEAGASPGGVPGLGPGVGQQTTSCRSP